MARGNTSSFTAKGCRIFPRFGLVLNWLIPPLLAVLAVLVVALVPFASAVLACPTLAAASTTIRIARHGECAVKKPEGTTEPKRPAVTQPLRSVGDSKPKIIWAETAEG